MRQASLIATAIALSLAAAAGTSAVSAAEQQPLNPKAIAITLPDQLLGNAMPRARTRPQFCMAIRTSPVPMC